MCGSRRWAPLAALCAAFGCGTAGGPAPVAAPTESTQAGHEPAQSAAVEPETPVAPDPFASAVTLDLDRLRMLVDTSAHDELVQRLSELGIQLTCDAAFVPAGPHEEQSECAPVPVRVRDVPAYLVVTAWRHPPNTATGAHLELRAPDGASAWLQAMETALAPRADPDDPLQEPARFVDLEDGDRQMRWGDRINTFRYARDGLPDRVELRRHTRGGLSR